MEGAPAVARRAGRRERRRGLSWVVPARGCLKPVLPCAAIVGADFVADLSLRSYGRSGCLTLEAVVNQWRDTTSPWGQMLDRVRFLLPHPSSNQ